jgi:hypothetical protein
MKQSKIIVASQIGAPIYYHGSLQCTRKEIQRSFCETPKGQSPNLCKTCGSVPIQLANRLEGMQWHRG